MVDYEDFDPDFEVWKNAAQVLKRRHRDLQWKVGAWLLAGEKEFGKDEAYKTAAALTGYANATLREIAKVAKQVHRSVRTKKLSWNHHRVVANLEPDAQKDWLRQALANDMSVETLRREVKRRPLPGHPRRTIKGGGGRHLKIVRLTDADEKAIRKLAEVRKVTPGELIRHIVIQHLQKPETFAELENAEKHARARATENRRAGWKRYEKRTIRSIDALLEQFANLPGATMPDISDFVAAWEAERNRKFPFHLAMKRSEFGAHYAGLSEEDAHCGEYSDFELGQHGI